MVIGTRVDAGIREPCEVDPCSPDQADKSGGHRDDSCKITLFDAPICWLRTIHRHTASEAFHYPTNMSPMICQTNSRRVPIDRKLGFIVPWTLALLRGSRNGFVGGRLAYFRLKRTESIAPVATAAR